MTVSKTIEVIFQGQDKLSSTIGSVSGHIADFSGSIQDATKPLLDMSVAILKVDAVVGALPWVDSPLRMPRALNLKGPLLS